MQRSGKRGFTKVGQLGPVVVVLILASTLLNGSGSAKAGVILNPSFESPTTSTHVYAITDWGRTSSTGVFNNSAGYGNFITNADGNQLAFINADGHEIWQDLSINYQPGFVYRMTVGLAARSDNPTAPNATFDLRFAYRDPGAIILNRSPVAYSALSNSQLRDFSVWRTATPGDPYIGKPVVIWLKANGNLGDPGDWTADNVRLDIFEAIPVPNFSFESPDLGAYDAGSGFGSGTWQTTGQSGHTGRFKNNASYGNFMNNTDGDSVGEVQMAWMNITAGTSIYQDLPSVYEVARWYELIVGVGARAGQTVGPNTTMAIELYYRDALGNPQVIGQTLITHGSLSNTALTDFSVKIPPVLGTDPWYGKQIGIRMRSVGVESGSGDWTLDNVRLLTGVPEPATGVLLVLGLLGFAAVGVRCRHGKSAC